MKFIEHHVNSSKVVEVVSDKIVINSEQDALDIMANIGYQFDCSKIIMHKNNISEDFFKLSTGLAGSVLQKFSNYKVQLAIIGNQSTNSKSLNNFIIESNRNKQIIFTDTISDALSGLI